MRKNILFVISFMILVSTIYTSSVFGYYRDTNWECTNSGERGSGDFYGRYSSSFNNGVCTKTCCILCVSQHPISDCFGGNAQPMCSCRQSSTGGQSTDTTPPVLTVNGPVTNTIFNKRAVNFDLSASERVKLEYLDNNKPQTGYKLLCTECTSFKRQLIFNEGLNNIKIRAKDPAGNKDEKDIMFRVDSKAPRISKTEPVSGKFGTGDFKVYYDEDNVKEITLKYRLSSSSQLTSTARNDCESGTRKNCTLNANLQDGDYYYNFEVEDIIGKKVSSRAVKMTIDKTNPIITLNSSLSNGQTFTRFLPLRLSISEKASLEYKDLNGNSRFNLLCRNCNSYTRNINFNKGQHNLVIRATDKAGNKDEESFSFNIN